MIGDAELLESGEEVGVWMIGMASLRLGMVDKAMIGAGD